GAVGSSAGVQAAAALSTRHSSGHCPWTSPTAMTLITSRHRRSRANRYLADQERPELAVELTRLLGVAAVPAEAHHEPGGLGPEPLGREPLDESVEGLVRLGALGRGRLRVRRRGTVRGRRARRVRGALRGDRRGVLAPGGRGRLQLLPQDLAGLGVV